MGRAQLSTRYGIDSVTAQKPTPQQPPRYIDAPFDLDAEAPDAVYEAFLTPDEVRQRQEAEQNNGVPDIRSVLIPPRESAPSPVESIDSDGDASSDATTTQPSTRVPSPRADSPAESGLRVLTLLEPLSAARDAATPAIQVAVAAGVTDCAALVLRLTAIIRPHITAALAPYHAQVPEVEFLGHMFERSIVLDVLGQESMTSSSMAGPRFSRNDILAALNAADEAMYTVSSRGVGAGETQELVEDPGSDDPSLSERASAPSALEDYVFSPTTEDNPWWNAANSPELPDRVAATPSPPPLLPADVDTDDDSSSSAASSSSAPRSPAAFAPRVFRVRDLAVIRPRPSVQVPPIHDPYLAMNHFRTPSPLR